MRTALPGHCLGILDELPYLQSVGVVGASYTRSADGPAADGWLLVVDIGRAVDVA
jgi:hypothetical protein